MAVIKIYKSVYYIIHKLLLTMIKDNLSVVYVEKLSKIMMPFNPCIINNTIIFL